MPVPDGYDGPVRMCAICRERFPKQELHRYALPAAGAEGPLPDPEQKLPGRGIYVCGQDACREKFGKLGKRLMKKNKGKNQ